MGSIRLHPEHGINPSLAVCFWCGKDEGSIMLLGAASKRITGQDEAPRRCVYGYEPCDECKKNRAQGITLIEAQQTPNEYPEIAQGTYPTGRWSVIKEEAARRVFTGPEAEAMLKKRIAFIPREVSDLLGLFREEVRP